MHRIQWLSKHDDDLWVTLWAFICWVPEFLDDHLKRSEGIPLTEYITLLAIARSENSTTMTKLANRTRMSPSRLSHVMDRLDKLGLTERTRSETDRRSTMASLTASGDEFLTKATPSVIDRLHESIFDALTPEEREQLGAILSKILQRSHQSIAV